jgi:replicative DNA helicase
VRTDTPLETDILAAVLHDSRLVGSLLRHLEAEDFASEQGRQCFSAIAQVAKRDGSDAVAPGTVRAELARQGFDERQILALMDPLMGIGAVGSFEPKCRRLRSLRRLRRIDDGLVSLRTETDSERAEETLREMLLDVGRLTHRELSSFADVLDEMMDEREQALARESRIRTGVPTLDRLLDGGIAPGWFAVYGARTGVGKTLLACQTAYHGIRAGHRVLYVTLEEARTQIAERITRHAKRLAKVPPGQLDPLFSAALDDDIRSLPLLIEQVYDLTQIEGLVREMAIETAGLGLVVVDYIGLVRAGKFENRVQEMSEVTRRLKVLAMEARVPVVGLAQVNRSPLSRSDRRPMLSDLRESGSIEQDADVVVLLHRNGEIEGRDGELRLAKNRYGAPAALDITFEYAIAHIRETETRVA